MMKLDDFLALLQEEQNCIVVVDDYYVEGLAEALRALLVKDALDMIVTCVEGVNDIVKVWAKPDLDD